MRSIKRYLLLWVLGALAAGSLLLAAVVYVSTREEINEVFNADLANVAGAVARYQSSIGAGDAAVPRAGSAADPSAAEYEIVTQTWSRSGERRYVSNPATNVAFADVAGLSRQPVGGDEWIVYTTPMADGWAQAAQRASSRRGMARESSLNVLPPMLALVLVVGALLSFDLRRGLRSLDSAARSVAARSAGSLAPIATEGVPREIEPMVSSINGLMNRLAVAFSAQRRFLADARTSCARRSPRCGCNCSCSSVLPTRPSAARPWPSSRPASTGRSI